MIKGQPRYFAGIALGVGLALSILASLQVQTNIEDAAVEHFAMTSDQVTLKIRERLWAYALLLNGGAGLFAGSQSVDRKEWKAYVEKLRAKDTVHGVQGIGFSQVIQPDQLAAHVAGIRAEGFPAYVVHPPQERALYTSIIYLEPFRDRNLRAFGFDMFSESVRRAAMEHARDTGAVALSGKVELVQETSQEVQAGTLMYVPVYRNGAPATTIEDRRDALIGWVYSPYRMQDLMEGILVDWKRQEGKRVDLEIFDGPEAMPSLLLFHSNAAHAQNGKSIFYQQRTIDFGGRQWLLAFDAIDGTVGLNYASAWATLLGGMLLSGLLSGLILALTNTQAKAEKIADTLTDEIRCREDLLRASEFRWRFAIEGSGDGLWDWNVPQSTVFFSSRWKEMLGFAPDEVGTGLDEWSKRIHPDDRVRVMADVQAHLDGLTPLYVNEHRVSCKDGSWKWILDRGLVVERDAASKPLRVIGTHSDVTERRQADAELTQHRDHLEEIVLSRTAELIQARDDADAANRAKSIFLATMSHEMRTPMNGVMGMIDLVLRRATDPKQIDWLNKSKDAAQHLLMVINDILDISKIEAERLTLEERNFSLTKVFEDTVQMQAEAAQAKGLRLSHEIAPAVPDELCGDPTRLKQILINFVGNAIKFSERGQITVSARAVEEDRFGVLLRIEVTDQGIGISPEAQARLFHPFTQADGTMTRQYAGTGLGLAIAKRIATLMGGGAGVISEAGQGSTFWATLRMKKGTGVVVAPATEGGDAEGEIRRSYGGHRILVVDDAPINAEIAQIQLEAAGLVVDMAQDGAEAVAQAQKNSYSVIFMDMQMPKLGGLEATRQIRQMPGHRHTPIIAMTANAYAEDKVKCISAGMDDVLVKPFTPDELFSILLRSLSRGAG